MTCFLNLIIMKKNYWNGLVLKLKRTLYPINRILHLFSYLSLATKKSKKNEVLLFNVGYLFLQSICSNLHFDNICRNIKNHHKFEYDIHRILCDLVYARVLYPSSKRSSFSFAHSLLEQPKYKLQDIYRSLSILAEESDYIQAEVYRNSNFLHKRNTKFFIMTVRTITLKSNKKMNLKNTEKAKNIVQILS